MAAGDVGQNIVILGEVTLGVETRDP